MRALPWLIGGGAAALGAILWRREALSQLAPAAQDTDAAPVAPPVRDRLPGQWVWPLGVWQARSPGISDGFDGRRRDARGQLIPHGGVDLMYRRRIADQWRVGSPNGSRQWIMPDHRFALAASDGVVWFAAETPRGYSVIVDHSPRHLATYYTHLSELRVHAKDVVRAGQPLGVVGADPLDGQHLMHLHFEIWRGAASTRFDPAPYMRDWIYLDDPGDAPAMVARSVAVPRSPRVDADADHGIAAPTNTPPGKDRS